MSKLTKLTKRSGPESGFSGSQTPASHGYNSQKSSYPVGRSGTIGPSAGAALVQQHQQHLLQHAQNQQQNSFFSAPNTPNSMNMGGTTSPINSSMVSSVTNQSPVSGGGGSTGTGAVNEEIKPRSLRFTWSMKTTSSLAPDDIMKLVLLFQ